MHCVYTVLGIDKSIDDDMLYLAALLHDIGKPLSACKSNRAGDIYCHYYGQPEKSAQAIYLIPNRTFIMRNGTL